MNTHVVIPDGHAHYKHNNDRALWVGQLIADLKPTVVINLGDSADMPSLSSYDKGTRGFTGRSYKADIDSHNDYQEKLWHACKKSKRKMPGRVTLIGNHEQRIDRALDLSPQLEGTISYADLNLDKYYDIVVPYEGNTPGVIEIDGVHYAHYFISGVLGKPIGGQYPAASLLAKKYVSCTMGHAHVFDYATRTRADGSKIHGLVAGCYQDYMADWAGLSNGLWSRGVVIKRNVEGGNYDIQWVSIEALRKEYAKHIRK